MVEANEALERLQQGNARFVANVRSADAFVSQLRRAELVQEQRPFACILGCSDSRVPAEIVFDQGLGALFVIRVAGNIVAPSQLGSVEFAAELLRVRLVVVLGHTGCGVVDATLSWLQGEARSTSSNMMSIVERMRPSVQPLMRTDLAGNREALAREAVRANVRASTNQIRHGTALMEQMQLDGLRVLGAEYDLASGAVDFFDGV